MCAVALRFLLTSNCVSVMSITVAKVHLFNSSGKNLTNCIVLTVVHGDWWVWCIIYCSKLSFCRHRDAQSWEMPALGQWQLFTFPRRRRPSSSYEMPSPPASTTTWAPAATSTSVSSARTSWISSAHMMWPTGRATGEWSWSSCGVPALPLFSNTKFCHRSPICVNFNWRAQMSCCNSSWTEANTLVELF